MCTGWDKDWGWGYVDLSAAYDHSSMSDNVSQPGYSRWYSATLNAGDKVTLVWNLV